MADTEKKNHFFESHVRDLFRRAVQTDYPAFTDFLTSGEQVLLHGMSRQLREYSDSVSVELWGGHEDCSHVVAGFFPREYLAYRLDLFPVACLCISPSDSRYHTPLTHRDYLGAIMNLGTRRSLVGDIRIHDTNAYVFCKNEIAPFIQEQLSMVGRENVSCTRIGSMEQIPPQQYEILSRSIASPRLDNIVAAMTGKSRGTAADLIAQGKVVVDSVPRTSTSFACSGGCVVSIRGYGKYRLQMEEHMVTRKGRQKIQIYKYI